MHVKARGQSWNVLNKEPRCTHEDGNQSCIIWSKHPQFSPFADWKLVFVRSFRVFLVWIRYRLLLYFTEAAELGNLRQPTLRKRQGFRSIVEQDIELLLKWTRSCSLASYRGLGEISLQRTSITFLAKTWN